MALPSCWFFTPFSTISYRHSICVGWHALSPRRAWGRPHALRGLRACHPTQMECRYEIVEKGVKNQQLGSAIPAQSCADQPMWALLQVLEHLADRHQTPAPLLLDAQRLEQPAAELALHLSDGVVGC